MARPSRKDEIYNFVAEKCRSDGEPPTIEEIARHLNLKAVSNIFKQLRQLVDEGRLIQYKRKYIPSHMTKGGTPLRIYRVPVLGRVAAGQPILAIEDLEGYVPYIPGGSESPSDLFALRIKGDSMIDIGILDGDIVIVESTPVLENGEIGVALIDNEATVKRIYKEKNCFRLQPENSKMQPIYTDKLSIIGRVIACSRSYRK